MEYLTRDNITLFLSIIGSAGTALSWIYTWLKSRKKLSIKVIKICKIKDNLIMYISISNQSASPICIEGLNILFEGNAFPCSQLPTMVFKKESKHGDVVVSSKEYLTIPLPINLSSSAGTSGYLAFDIPQDILQNMPKPLIVQVCTNRGKAVEKKLEYDEENLWNDMF